MLAKVKRFKMHPAQIIVFGFVALILLGGILLTLPISTQPGHRVSFLDALFTSTSATCVTGLVVVDTALTYTLFGQIVILLLIQFGGLGVMTVMTLMFIMIGKRITLSERMILKEALNEFDLAGLVKMILKVIKVTVIAESLGALLLATRFVPLFGLKGVYFSVFHAVSAFCNAGFDVLGQVSGEYSNMAMFKSDPVVMLTLSALIFFGGLGFVVVSEMFSVNRIKNRKKLSRYSKLVLVSNAFLIALGLIAVFSLELGNPATLGGMDTNGKIFSGIFEVFTPRTAGFSSFNQEALMPATKLVVIVLMFIGASPAGTGGGIKTTTAAIVAMFTLSGIFGHKDINLRERRVSEGTGRRAIVITVASLMLVMVAAFILFAIEGHRGGLFTPENLLFEVVSAFGTVGLSAGVTPDLSAVSEIVLILVMLAGRVGLVTLVISLSSRAGQNHTGIRYPEERFMVG